MGKKIPEVLAGGELTLEGAEKRLVWGMGSGKELEKGDQRSGRETMKRGAKESAFERAPPGHGWLFLGLFCSLGSRLKPVAAGLEGGRQCWGEGTYPPAARSRNANEAKNKCSTSKLLSHRQSVGRCRPLGAPGGAHVSLRAAAPRVCTHMSWGGTRDGYSHRPFWPSMRAQAAPPPRPRDRLQPLQEGLQLPSFN